MRSVPWVARWVIGCASEIEDRPFLLADLEEVYRARLARAGRFTAWRWYWWQALRSIPARLGSGTVPIAGPGRGGPGLGGRSTIRQTTRLLSRRPLYAGGVIATLGLGLGSAAAVFAVAWAAWLRPLPFPDPDRITRLYEVNLRPASEGGAVAAATADVPRTRWNRMSPPLLVDIQQADLSTVEAAATLSAGGYDWVREDGRVVRVSAQLASLEAFGILGIRPVVGRLPSGVRGAREIVLTESFWQSTFGGHPGVVGRVMTLDGESYVVAGVIRAPAGFPEATDIWSPLVFEPGALEEGMRGARYLDVIARVAPGRTVAEASAEIDAFIRNLGEAHPNHQQWGGTAVPLRADLARPFRGIFIVLLGAGAIFLLLATVNVAGLVAARRAEARRERSIRIALGASRAQILREGLVESVILGLGGALVAVAGVQWVLSPIRRLLPRDVPRLTDLGAGPGLMAGLVAAGLVAGAMVGLLGHLMSGSRENAIAGSRDAGRPSVRGRRILLVTQVALTTWLLIGGTALVRHVLTLRAVDTGFEPEGVSTAFIALSAQRQGANSERSRLFWEDLLNRLSGQVAAAAVATNAPVSGSSMRFGYAVEGDDSPYWGQYHAVTPAYFDVMGIDVTSGRSFTQADRPEGQPVVIINEALARTHYPGQDPVGRTLRVVGTQRTIVGVARSTRHFGPDQEPPPELYVPFAQDPSPFAHVLLSGDPVNVLAPAVAAIDPYIVVPPVQPFADYIREWFAPLRLQLVVIGVFAIVGAILAALGIYALVAYVVSNGKRDIGIRMALGERTRTVFGRVLSQGFVLTVVGIALGSAAALIAHGMVQAVVQLETITVGVIVVVGGSVILLALMASAVPARRAIAVDPIVTLRADG